MTTGRPRVGLFGYFGMGNIGNEGSLTAVLNWLRDVHPEVPVHCFSAVPEAVRRDHGIAATQLMSFRADPHDSGLWSSVRKAASRAWDIPRTFAMMRDVDVLVVPGTGVLESKLVARPWGLPYWLFLAALACRLRRRKVALVSVGAEPPVHRVTALLYRWTVRLANYCTLRDPESAIAVREMGGGRSDRQTYPDLAFALPAPSPRPVCGRVVIGVMEYEGGSDHPDRGPGVVATYAEKMVHVIDRLLTDGRSVVLVVGDEADFGLAFDICDRVRATRADSNAERLSVSPARTLDAVMTEMALAEVVVATRFHTLVCALKLMRPTVSLGYADKNGALLARFGLGGFSQPADSFDAELLVWQVTKVCEALPGVQSTMEEVLREGEERLTLQFQRISAELFGGAR